MARQKSEVTLAIEALVAENPDLTAAEALPKLADAGYGEVKDYTFNNLKSKLLKAGSGKGKAVAKSKANGKASAKTQARPKVHQPEPARPGVSESFQFVRDDFGGSVEEAEAYVAQAQAYLAVVRETLALTADVG